MSERIFQIIDSGMQDDSHRKAMCLKSFLSFTVSTVFHDEGPAIWVVPPREKVLRAQRKTLGELTCHPEKGISPIGSRYISLHLA